MSVLQRLDIKLAGGDPTGMAFAHGFGGDQNMWRFVAPAFEADFRPVLFDYIDAGGSDFSGTKQEVGWSRSEESPPSRIHLRIMC